MFRWAQLAAAFLLVPALAVGTLANCLDPEAVPQAVMACCQQGHAHCPMQRGMSQTARDCCHRQGQTQHQLFATEHQPVQTLIVTFVPVGTTEAQSSLAISSDSAAVMHRSGSSPAPPLLPSISTVLLI